MARYRDSATGTEDACPGAWFDCHLVKGIRAFRGQFGFFRYSALEQYAPVLECVAAECKPVNLVLGSNVTDPLTHEDVMSVWQLMASGNDVCHLTVVAYNNELFHPKVAHVVHADEKEAAMVGSANLTSAALGRNVEAWIEASSGTSEDDVMLAEIVRATDWWHSANESGVFQVKSAADADRLLDEGILIREAQREMSSTSHTTATVARGSRSRRWSPSSSMRVAETEGERLDAGTDSVQLLRWCKRLRKSDAQQTVAGTNPTGTLRLARAGHDIDKNTWFREQLFGSATWVSTSRGGKEFEEAHVTFNVELPGRKADQQVLLVDHAPHRAAGQNNVVTLIHWGTALGQWLPRNDQTDKWVVIERGNEDEHQLRIEDTKPSWAP